MNKNYTDNIEEIIEYGLDQIDPKEMVEVNLKDLIYVYNTLIEFMRFFHQLLHYQTLEDVNKFLGSINDNRGFKVLHTRFNDGNKEISLIGIAGTNSKFYWNHAIKFKS